MSRAPGAGISAGPPFLSLRILTVGEVTANQIISYRAAHPFRSVEDLRQVPGIGDRRFELLKDLVTVAGAS